MAEVDGVSKQAPAGSVSIISNFVIYFQQLTLHFLASLPPHREGLVKSMVSINCWLTDEPASFFVTFWPKTQEQT